MVTGQTGSGKSTSLAAIIDYLNENFYKKIITLEDPIDPYMMKKILFSKEIGDHAKTYSSALKATLREDPDVILVGELRDLETIQRSNCC